MTPNDHVMMDDPNQDNDDGIMFSPIQQFDTHADLQLDNHINHEQQGHNSKQNTFLSFPILTFAALVVFIWNKFQFSLIYLIELLDFLWDVYKFIFTYLLFPQVIMFNFDRKLT